MSDADKCPNCSAARLQNLPTYKCGSEIGVQGEIFPTLWCYARKEAIEEINSRLSVAEKNGEAWRTKAARCEDEMNKQAARANAAESRVKELEGLLIGNEDFRDGEIWIEVLIPQDRLGGERVDAPYISTLGNAMPRKEEL